jgi:hypothetical protein
MKRYRAAGAGAGLVRVEVLVPPEGRNAIIDEAARIRAAHRGGMAASLAQLYDEAVWTASAPGAFGMPLRHGARRAWLSWLTTFGATAAWTPGGWRPD